jgi:shikimate dehydrogenase
LGAKKSPKLYREKQITLKTKSKYGLLGKNISYSFSKNYFTAKFDNPVFEGCTYENFDIQSIAEFPNVLAQNHDLNGLNVTIPYKESILPYLDRLSKTATEIGAVNVIKFTKKGTLKGYNSDWYGCKKSLQPYLKPHHKKAVLLGTGGASKAIAYALQKLDITATFVSRNPAENELSYNQLTKTIFDEYQLIINCTPLGTSPNSDTFPPIPYEYITPSHLVFDLVYNPEKTVFLKQAEAQGATIVNGYEMLIFQAEKAWKLWHK